MGHGVLFALAPTSRYMDEFSLHEGFADISGNMIVYDNNTYNFRTYLPGPNIHGHMYAGDIYTALSSECLTLNACYDLCISGCQKTAMNLFLCLITLNTKQDAEKGSE